MVPMLVPLETLPGWPAAQAPTALQALGLLIGIPAVLFVIIAGLAKVSAMVSASRYPSSAVPDSVWLGANAVQPAPEEMRSIDGLIEDHLDRPDGEVAAEEGDTADALAKDTSPPTGATGGASARW